MNLDPPPGPPAFTAPVPPPAEPTAAERFRRMLEEATPRVYVTPALLAINVAVFVAMLIAGARLMSPEVKDLIRFGADYGPRTTGGEPWRLLTSTFVHIGVIHLLMNMAVLAQIGPLMERLLGNAGYLVLYLVAGLCGAITSSLWSPYLVSAGASGAIFGLYGALLGFLARDRGSIPQEVLAGLKRGAVVFVGYNLLFGLTQKNVDLAAHFGGFAGGFLAALPLAHPLTPDAVRRRLPRNFELALVGVALFALFVAKAPRMFDLQGALERMGQVEHRSLAAVNAAIDRAQASGSDRELADLIERDVLPPWRRSLAELEGARRLPGEQARLVTRIVTYMKARAEGWELLAAAVKNHDPSLIQRANEKQAEADKLANEIAR